MGCVDRYTVHVPQISVASRARIAAMALAALALHVLVLLALAAQLPDAHASRPVTSGHGDHVAHAPLAGKSGPSQVAYVDLTPPEVRNLGGPTLVEVLEGPPALRIPGPFGIVDEVLVVNSAPVPDEHLASVRFGRAPPVR
jgi:hypothetical protein